MKNDKFIQDIYGIVPISLLSEHGHKSTVLCTYISIASFQGGNDYAYPSIDKIAERASLSSNAVISAMRELVKTGWVERKKRYGNTNIYYVKTKARDIEKTNIEDVKKIQKSRKNLKNIDHTKNSCDYKNSGIDHTKNSGIDHTKNSCDILKEQYKITDKKNMAYPINLSVNTKDQFVQNVQINLPETYKLESEPIDQKINTNYPEKSDSSVIPVIVPDHNRLTNSNYGTLVHPIKNYFKEVLNKQSYLNGFRESYSCGKAELKAIDDYLKTELDELGKPDFDATLNKAKTFIDQYFELLAKDEATRQDKFFNPSLSTVLGGKRNQWILRYLELDKSTKKTEKVKVTEILPEQVKELFEKRKSLFDKLLSKGINDPEKRMQYFCENKQDFEILKHDISFSGNIIIGSDLHHAITEDEKYKAKISNKDIKELSVIW